MKLKSETMISLFLIHREATCNIKFNKSKCSSLLQSLWNEPYNRKYTKKPTCLPLSQVQRFGRQILEALIFLRERGITSHGHLHSGNVIIQNGVARYMFIIKNNMCVMYKFG